jgi:hypothetical protein
VMGYDLLNGVVHPLLLSPNNCNSDEFNGTPTLLTKSRANSISMARLAQQYRGLLGKAGFRGALPWLLRSNLRTGIGKPK